MSQRKSATQSVGKMNFQPQDITANIRPGETILEVALAHDVPIGFSCGGMGSCGTCHVFVESGLERFQPRNEIEIERANDLDFKENERLACQNEAFDGLIVRVPGDHW